MALLEVNWHPSARQLRWFALALAVIVGGLATIRAERADSLLAIVVGVIAIVLGLVGVWRPSFVRPVYLAWMTAAYPIGWVVSHTLLVSIYLVVVTPIGLVMRALRHDPMKKRFDRSTTTYWAPREEVSKQSRYLQQF